MVTEKQIKLARDKFKEISGIAVYTPDEGTLDDFEQARYDGLVAALEAALSAVEPVKVRNDDVGFVDFLNADRPYICRKTEGTCYLLIDRETGDVVGYRKYDDETIDTPAPSVDVKAEDLARQLWGYFEGDSTGGTTAMQWFDNNKSLGGPAHVIALCRSALSAQVQDVAGWQPIETAPKDGTKFLAICKTGFPGQFIGQCYYVGPDKRYPTANLDWFMNLDGWPQPTHWMPLPAAPAKQEG